MSPSSLDFLASPSFVQDVEKNTIRWDAEWIAYWSRHKDYSFRYFINTNTIPDEKFDFPIDRLCKMAPREFFHFKPWEHYAFAVWLPGAAVMEKTVVELGCGPGLLGKILGRVCHRYIGIDYSPLALYIAKIVSPSNCSYFHLSEVPELKALEGQADVCVGRYFFIHQNFGNAKWVLTLFRGLLKSGGTISADFYARGQGGNQPSVILPPDSPLHEKHPSCVFEYEPHHIDNLAAEVGLDVVHVDYDAPLQRRFAIFRKP